MAHKIKTKRISSFWRFDYSYKSTANWIYSYIKKTKQKNAMSVNGIIMRHSKYNGMRVRENFVMIRWVVHKSN